MSENPYTPPTSDLVSSTSKNFALAPRGSRLLAVIIDGLISMVVILPIMYFTGGFKKITQGPDYSFSYYILMTIFGFILFFIIHGKLLINNGQTIGKKAVDIRIADLEGNVPDFKKSIIPRYIFTTVIANIPLIGGLLSLVDSLMIFRKDKRCLHDLVAKTQVVTEK